MHENIIGLRKVEPDLIPEDINAASSSELSAGKPPLTGSKILIEFFDSKKVRKERKKKLINACDTLEEKQLECPGKTQLLVALELHQIFS